MRQEIRRGLRRRYVLTAVALLVVGAATASVYSMWLPSGAAATTHSEIRPLLESSIDGDIKDGVANAAERAGLDPSTIRQISPADSGGSRLGLFVGRDARGRELVAFLSPMAFSSFTDARRIVALEGGVFVSASAQADRNGDAEAAQLMGVADPSVTSVEIDLADGQTIVARLLQAYRGGHSFFTYDAREATAFPQTVRASNAGGHVATVDVARAIRPPANH